MEWQKTLNAIADLLKLSPNLANVDLDNLRSFNRHDFQFFEDRDLNFYPKLVALPCDDLDEHLGNFLLSHDFSSLRRITFRMKLKLPYVARIVEKYADQLTSVRLNLGKFWQNGEYEGIEQLPVLTLPVMNNLKSLSKFLIY